jgi:peptidoglycan/LPS O-acetylase OafA/YrhL
MRKHVHGLDLMRAVAIAMVVFQHGALFFYLCYGSPVIWTKMGTIGVTLFFVLSGFLIGGILLDLGGSLGDSRVAARFWLRRALRTLPNYFLFIVFNVAFCISFNGRGVIQARCRCSPGTPSSCRISHRKGFGSFPSHGPFP